MKKKVLCIFSMIFLVLVTCTILSTKIEEEMMLEVIGYEKKESYSSFSMPKDMFFTDEYGMHLYEVYQGTGWESGLRAREVQLDGNGSFMTDRDYIIVRGASRQPVYGELAELYDGTDTAPATYLAIYPNGIPEENSLLFQAKILEQSPNVLLLYMENGTQPFTENRTKGGLVQLTSSNWKIYSLDALTQLLENVPAAMAAIVLVAAMAVFGINTCVLSKNPKRNKWFMWTNGILIAALLSGLVWILAEIDFPSSMLPSENIFRISHYRTELAALYGALEELSGDTTRTFTALREATLRTGYSILIAGCAVIGVVTVLELCWAHGKPTRKVKYIGKYLSNAK